MVRYPGHGYVVVIRYKKIEYNPAHTLCKANIVSFDFVTFSYCFSYIVNSTRYLGNPAIGKWILFVMVFSYTLT